MQAVVICAWSSRAPIAQDFGGRPSIAPVAWVRQRSIHSGQRYAEGRIAVRRWPPRLVDRARRQRHAAQRASTFGPCRRNERSFRPDRLVEPVEHRRRVDQRPAVVKHQRGNATERIDPAHRVEIREHRARIVLIVEAEDAQRHRYPADERRAILTDQNHAFEIHGCAGVCRGHRGGCSPARVRVRVRAPRSNPGSRPTPNPNRRPCRARLLRPRRNGSVSGASLGSRCCVEKPAWHHLDRVVDEVGPLWMDLLLRASDMVTCPTTRADFQAFEERVVLGGEMRITSISPVMASRARWVCPSESLGWLWNPWSGRGVARAAWDRSRAARQPPGLGSAGRPPSGRRRRSPGGNGGSLVGAPDQHCGRALPMWHEFRKERLHLLAGRIIAAERLGLFN